MRKKKLFLCILVELLFVTWMSVVNADIRIMPLGDSITRGNQSNSELGYRGKLQKKFNPAAFKFVGSEVYGLMDGEPLYHEGHPGMNASFIENHIKGFLEENNPDIVLLHIGTNDLRTLDKDEINKTVIETTVNTIGKILTKIHDKDPEITVFLARIINMVPKNNNISEFNIKLYKRFQNRVNIIIVDMEKNADMIYELENNGGDIVDDAVDIHGLVSQMVAAAAKAGQAYGQGLKTLDEQTKQLDSAA